MAAKKPQFVVVRTYSAGVHTGELVEQNGKLVQLANARRLWRWKGANTLNEVASKGVSDEYTRLSEPVASVTLTEAIEVLSTTAEARRSLEKSRWGA